MLAPISIVFAVILAAYGIWRKSWVPFIAIAVGLLIALISYNINISMQTSDIEMWSGTVTKAEHKEEWDEWHPPVDTTHYTYDDEGNITGSYVTTTPGYWEHHPAENYIWTSDGGSFSISLLSDGKRANDTYINTTEELISYYPIGMPSASYHTYENRVKASYSIYKHNDINEDDYPDLPDYPSNISNYIHIDRITGMPWLTYNSEKRLMEVNAYMNRMIDDEENPGKMRAWKQANLQFVNVGENKPYEYGFALQNKWRNGAKNDIIVSYSLDSNNKVLWCLPFSWSEMETFKIEIRDYMINKTINNDDEMIEVINYTSERIIDGFVRKQFRDFNYLKVEVTTGCMIWIFIMYLIMIGISIYVRENEIFS